MPVAERVERSYLLRTLGRTYASNDTESRHFKAWLRKRTFPQDSFTQRFLAESRFKPQASRSLYEQQLKAWGYTDEDVQTFRDLWKAMLLQP